jgi:hypothetical protein
LFWNPEQLGSFVKATKDVTDLITSISTKDAKKSMKAPWKDMTEQTGSIVRRDKSPYFRNSDKGQEVS